MAKQTSAPRTPAQCFQRALQLLQQGQLATAEQLLRDLTTRFPLHFDGLHLLGLCHLRRQDWQPGLALLQRAMAVNDGVAGLHNNCGIALRELRQWDAALRHYDRALQLQPDHADAHNNRGNVLRDLQRYADRAAFEHRREVRAGGGNQLLASLLLRGRAAAAAHTQVQVDKGVVSATIGHRMVRRRVGQHPCATGGKHLLAGFIVDVQHAVGQAAAKGRHVSLGVKLAGVEDHQVRHIN